MHKTIGTFATYDLCNNIGTVIGIVAMLLVWRKKKLNLKQVLAGAAAMAAVIVVGGFFSSLFRQLNHMDFQSYGELARDVAARKGNHFIGRVLAAAFFFPCFSRAAAFILRQPYTKELQGDLLDALAFFIPIQHIFNRLACLMNGCCYGIPYHGLFALRFPDLAYPVFPSQIFEMACMAALLAVVVFFDRKGKPLFGAALIGFGLSIFLSEFFMDQQGNLRILGMNAIQYGSLLVCAIGIFYRKAATRRRTGE